MAATSRPHGRVKYVVERCRCDVCRVDATAYERHRQRQIAYGRWHPYVDAAPARQHVRALQEFGVGPKHLAVVADVPHGSISKLLYGNYRGRTPSKRVRSETASKLLAVEPSLDILGATVRVDGTGTRRRLQALVAIGWSQSKLAREIGMLPSNFTRVILKTDTVNAVTARAVRELYERLWSVMPPNTAHRDKIAYNRALRRARELGWAPPLAWDDDTIDDPDATPEGVGADRRRGNQKLPPVDDIRFLLGCGESKASIARRFGTTENTVEQALLRDRSEAA